MTNMYSFGAFKGCGDGVKRIGIVSGCFDLTHAGHYLFFQECRELCDILCVAVAPDSSLKNKGVGRPYQNQYIRLDQVAACRWVDEAAIAFNHLDELLSDLKEYNEYYLERKVELIYFVNDDAYSLPERMKFCADNNIKIVVLERVCPELLYGCEISTTQIAQKIINGADLHPFPAPTYEQLKLALELTEAENIELKGYLKDSQSMIDYYKDKYFEEESEY